MSSVLTTILILAGVFSGGCSLFFTLAFFSVDGWDYPSDYTIPIVGFVFSGLFFFLAWLSNRKKP